MTNLIGNNSEKGLGGQVGAWLKAAQQKLLEAGKSPRPTKFKKKSRSSWSWRRTSTKCGRRKSIAAKARHRTRCRQGGDAGPKNRPGALFQLQKRQGSHQHDGRGVQTAGHGHSGQRRSAAAQSAKHRDRPGQPFRPGHELRQLRDPAAQLRSHGLQTRRRQVAG